MVLTTPSPANRRGSRGFSLMELMIAMVVLAVGLLAGLGLIVTAIARNGGPKTNTAAATLAESTLERIMAAPLDNTGASLPASLNDCAGNTFTINTAPGGPQPVNSTFGISEDFSQTPMPGYAMQYVNCAGGQGQTFDIRWTVEAGPTASTQLITVSARALGASAGPAAPFVRPVTLRALRGRS